MVGPVQVASECGPERGLEKIGDYFAVVDAVREVIGCEPDVVEEMAVKVDEVDLGRGFRVAWTLLAGSHEPTAGPLHR